MSEESLTALSATKAAAEIARGAISSEDYTRACLDRIAALEPKVQAFAHLDGERALTQARERDEWRKSGRPIGPLHGVPVGIKDIIDTSDYPTECGSPGGWGGGGGGGGGGGRRGGGGGGGGGVGGYYVEGGGGGGD